MPTEMLLTGVPSQASRTMIPAIWVNSQCPTRLLVQVRHFTCLSPLIVCSLPAIFLSELMFQKGLKCLVSTKLPEWKTGFWAIIQRVPALYSLMNIVAIIPLLMLVKVILSESEWKHLPRQTAITMSPSPKAHIIWVEQIKIFCILPTPRPPSLLAAPLKPMRATLRRTRHSRSTTIICAAVARARPTTCQQEIILIPTGTRNGYLPITLYSTRHLLMPVPLPLACGSRKLIQCPSRAWITSTHLKLPIWVGCSSSATIWQALI